MDLGAQTIFFAGFQNLTSLFYIESICFAEHIVILGDALPGNQRHHFLANQADIFLAVCFILLGHQVGTHESGHNVHGVTVIEILNDLQCLELMLGSKAIAALGFHSGGAKRHHLIQRQSCLGGQFLFGCLSGSIGGRLDTTAGILNFQVSLAMELHSQLILAPAAKNQMGMSIHQARSHQFATGIHHGLAVFCPGNAGANFSDDAVFYTDEGIIQKLHSPLLGTAFCGAAQRSGQQANVFNQ